MYRDGNIRPDFQKGFVIKIVSILILVLFSFTGLYAQYSTSTCSGTAFNFTQPGALTGTTYGWTIPLSNTGGVTGTAQNNQASVSELLLNTTTAPATLTYTVTPSSGSPFQLVVTVNPNPVLTSSLSPTTCSGSVFSYTPTSATTGSTFDWSRVFVAGISNTTATGTGNPNETLLNTTNNAVAVTVNYVYTASANGCTGNSQTVSVLVNPLPTINNTGVAPTARCSGNTYIFNPVGPVTGTTFSWTRAAISGVNNTAASGSGNPNESLINTSAIPVTVSYVFTSSANGCSNNQTVPVIVNPLPTLSSTQSPSAICSGSTFHYSPTSLQTVSFNWSRSATTNLNSGTVPTPGSGDPAEVLVNNSLVFVTANYTYTLTNSSTGCTNTQNVNVNVNPVPRVSTPQPVTLACSGNSFLLSPGNVPNGTLYTWANPVITVGGAGAISGGSAVNVGKSYISQTLTNNTASAATIEYTVTPSTNGCVGSDFLVDVTVNPGGSAVQISNPVAPAICSGISFNYTPTSTTLNVTYAWKRFLTNGISNGPTSGTGSLINETLTNTTTQPVTVYYAYTITDGSGCSNTQDVSVAVNPTPYLFSTLSPVPICSNTVFNYTPISATSVSSFTWTRAVVAGISNSSSSSSNTAGNISETLINTTNNPVTVSYVYTLTTASGCTNSQTVAVQVNPAPTLSSNLNPAAICSGSSFNYPPTSTTTGTVFSWARSAQASISNGIGSGTGNVSEILVNTSVNSITVLYNYTLTANGCSNTQVVNAIVNPTPNISDQATTICNNTSFSITPVNVPTGTQYTWTAPAISPAGSIANIPAQNPPQNSISSTGSLSNSSVNNATVTYTVTPSANSCAGVHFAVVVTVNPTPVLSSSLTPPAVCSNVVFNYTPASSGSGVGTSFTWTRAAVAGISSNGAGGGSGNISETLINTTSSAVPVVYSYSLTTPSGCLNIQTITVQVNPLPIFSSSLNPPAICSGSIFNYTTLSGIGGTVFSWSRSILSSISNGAATGTGNPAEILVNTGITVVTVPYNYTLTANGCSNTQTVNAIVNPTPNISDQATTICNNSLFTVTPSNVPASTQYTWGIPVQSPNNSITGGSAQGSLQNNISQTLSNTTTNNATATYTVTPTANNCQGANFSVIVTVSTIPTLSSSLAPPPVCSNAVFSYSPTSSTAGTIFNWTRAIVPNISNAAASGINSPNETLVNTSSVPVSVSYVYALTTSGGCVNNQTVTVQVKPGATLSSSLNPVAICSGATFAYSPSSATAGTIFSWVRNSIASISNNAGSGVTGISETLISTATIAITVPYVYTLTANGCSNTQIVNAIVDPTPNIPDQAVTICSGTTFNVPPANVPSATQYTWSTPVKNPLGSISGGTPQATPQNSISELLSNININNATAIYTVIPAANGCTGTSFNLTVTVNPVPVLSSSQTPAAVCSNSVFSYTPTSNTTGTAFSWTRSVVTGISNPAASGINNLNEALINITNQFVPVLYTYTITTTGGCVNNQTVTVQVNPAPILSSTLTPPAICSGTAFNYTPQSAIAGASFSWTRSVTPSISNGASLGTNNISEVLVNTSINSIAVPYNYRITANGCSVAQVVSVSVNPTPNINNLTAISCSNTNFTVNPGNVPAGTQYTWTAPTYNPMGSIAVSSAQLILQNNISQFLVNQTINAAVATYTVTPVASGCTGVSFTVAVTVNPAPVIANQLLAPVCSGTAFSYSAVNIPNGTTYTWSYPIQNPLNSLTGASSESINQQTISQTVSSVNNLLDTAIYTVTPMTNGCLGNSFTLTVPVSPVPVVNNVADTICTGSAFSIIPAPVPFNTTYTWSTPVSFPFGAIVGGNAQIIPATSISQILSNTRTTPAQLVYTVIPSAFGCRGASFTLVETVGVPLAVIPNKTAVICSGTAFDVTPTTTPPNTTYTWNIPSITPVGTVSGSSAMNSPQAVVSQTLTNLSSITDTVVYTVLPFNTGCRGNTFLATIRVLAVPKATITGNAVICRYPFDTLSVSFAGSAPWSFTYIDNNVTYTKSGITSSPYTWVLPALPNVSPRTVAINYVTDFACIDSTDISYFVQKVNPLPVGQINSLHGGYICNGIPDTLFVSYSSADTLRFQWTLNGSALPGITSDSVSTLSPGRYNAILTNQFGCIDTAASSVGLTVISKPILKFIYDSYCINNQIQFTNLTDTTFTGPIQWLWNMGDSTTRNTYNTTDTYITGGDRHIRLTASQLNCRAYATSIDSTINIQYPIAAVRLPSVSAYKNVFTPLAARSFPMYRYLWTPTRGIDYPDSALVNFNYQNTQDYIINLISPAGCITYDSLLVRVFDDNLVNILVPKSFTPNGDGNNDILYPYLAGIKTFQYFKVYNRYGKLMFETTNPDTGWNGYFNGTPQPMAIYIWMAVGIANDGTRVEKKGETLLLR